MPENKIQFRNGCPLLLLVILCTFSSCSGQNTKAIAGQYKDGSSVLYIFEDNTFMILAINSMEFGKVALNGQHIVLTPHKEKQKFALYGRKVKSRVYGNTIMFQGFDQGNGLVNLQENNSPLKEMQRVFNAGANCSNWPNFYDNNSDPKVIYFTEKNTDLVFEFKIPEGYRDFVAFRFEDKVNVESVSATASPDFKTIKMNGDDEMMKEPLTEEIMNNKKMGMSMYERVYPGGKYYYCNPAYNMFETEGIDISNYENIGFEGEGIFRLLGQNQDVGEPGSDTRLDYDYHDETIIYQYTRIEPTVILKAGYKIIEQSLFIANCK
ncbi:MAG: hypothetical protein ABI266_03885 [Ginsengibacter sp.]